MVRRSEVFVRASLMEQGRNPYQVTEIPKCPTKMQRTIVVSMFGGQAHDVRVAGDSRRDREWPLSSLLIGDR